MRAGGVPVTIVVGADSREGWYGKASAWLAEGTAAKLLELPGGHVGFLADPDRLLELVNRVARTGPSAAKGAS